MNFKQLYYFTVIAETGSISSAAHKLGLSQPPLSRQLAHLEEYLGIPLFARTAHGIELTGAGQVLYYRAKDILSMIDNTTEEVRSFHGGQSGTLKIGCISSSGILMTRLMDAFTRQYPLISIDLYEGNTYEVIEKLKNGLVECAIIRTPFNTDGLTCIYGPEEPLMAAGYSEFFKDIPTRPRTSQRSAEPSSPSMGSDWGVGLTSLLGKPLIYYRRFENIIMQAFANIGMRPSILCRNDDARTSLQWAGAGLGIALVPENISRLADSAKLEVHPILCEEMVTRMAAVCPNTNRPLSRIARNFLKIFEELQ